MLTFLLRLLLGAIWLIALAVATIVALPVLAFFSCLFVLWKLLAVLRIGLSRSGRRDVGILEL